MIVIKQKQLKMNNIRDYKKRFDKRPEFSPTLIIAVASFLLGVTVFSAAPAHSQNKLTLEQCLQMAHDNNIALSTEKSNLGIAQEQKKEAVTNFFPAVSAMGLGFEANKDLISLSMSGAEMGFVKNGLFGSVTAVQPVFAGGQIINGNKLAGIGVESSRLQLQQAENQVEITTEQYYWNVVTLKEKLNTINLIQQQLARMDKDVSAFVKAGITTRNDLLQVQLRENEVESQKTTITNALSVSKLMLAQYIGLRSSKGGEYVCGEFDIADETYGNVNRDSLLMLKRNHDSVLMNTPEYQLLEKNVEAKRSLRQIEIGKNLPSVGVGAGLSYNDLMESGVTKGLLFLSVKVPLSGWWGGSYAIRQKKIAEKNAEEQLTSNSELLIINMQRIWTEVENAYKNLKLARKSIEQSEENLRINTDLYNAGTSTMSDLIQAQSQYQQSRNSYVDAYSALEIQILAYKIATNSNR